MRRTAALAGLTLALLGGGLVAPPSASAAPPAHDSPAGAINVTAGSTTTFDTTEATLEPVEQPADGCSQINATVWYAFTPATTVDVTVTLEDGDGVLPETADTVLGVWSGPSDGASYGDLAPVTCNDDVLPGTFWSQATFRAWQGRTYYLQAGSYRSASGQDGPGVFRLGVGTEPASTAANDALANAQAITGLDGRTTVDTHLATVGPEDPAAPSDFPSPGASVWFAYTAPADGLLRFETRLVPGVDPYLEIFAATGATTKPEALDTGDDELDGLDGYVEVPATEGTTYRVLLATYEPDPGVVDLLWTLRGDPPPGDDFADARVLVGESDTVWDDNLFATAEPGDPARPGSDAPGGRSTWYSWTATETAGVEFVAGDVGRDTTLAAFTGPSLDALTPVMANDDRLGEIDTPASRVFFVAQAGTTYHLVVDGFPARADGVGPFSLFWGPTPVSDLSVTHTVERTDVQTLTYTSTLTNDGPGSPGYYWLEISPPVDAGLVSATTDGGEGWTCTSGFDDRVYCYDEAPLPLGTTTVTTVWALGDDPGIRESTASVTIDQPDPDTSDQTAGVEIDVQPPAETSTNGSASVAGRTVTLSADVTPQSGTVEPSGTVEFFEGATSLGSVPVGDDLALTDVPLGEHAYTATYTSDVVELLGSSSGTFIATVEPWASSTLLQAVATGTSVKLTATVAADGPAPVTGVVDFYEGDTPVGQAAVVAGKAVVTLTGVSPGRHTYRAELTPDSAEIAPSATSGVPVSVATPVVASITKLSAPRTAKVGSRPKVTVTVRRGAAAAAGSVTVTVNGTKVATVALRAGKAVVRLPQLKKGTVKVVAAYGGNATTRASSAQASITVKKPKK